MDDYSVAPVFYTDHLKETPSWIRAYGDNFSFAWSIAVAGGDTMIPCVKNVLFLESMLECMAMHSNSQHGHPHLV